MTKHIHLIGIGGSGLSAIARLLLERGYKVSGSDQILSEQAKELALAGAEIFKGHLATNILGAHIVVRSSAIPDDNPEVQAALISGIPVLKRADFLGELTLSSECIAVAGTHGKTTTTAMAAWVFHQLGLDPSYIIGGISKDLGRNAHSGAGSHFIIEADEYDRMFLGINPGIIIITSLEYDHPDCFETPEVYKKAFFDFIMTLRPGGSLFVNQKDISQYQTLGRLPNSIQLFKFGIDKDADYIAQNLQPTQYRGYSFDFLADKQSKILAGVTINVPGSHNVMNALAVLSVVAHLGLDVAAAAKALAKFSGTSRRFDILGTALGITIIDDYAHHPTEIRATLEAARHRFPNSRIWVVWQPHTYSRTLTFLPEFRNAFSEADRVIITEIYAAREKQALISGESISKEIAHSSVAFIPALVDVSKYLINNLTSGDVLLVLSAGDADAVSEKVLKDLIIQETNHAS